MDRLSDDARAVLTAMLEKEFSQLTDYVLVNDGPAMFLRDCRLLDELATANGIHPSKSFEGQGQEYISFKGSR